MYLLAEDEGNEEEILRLLSESPGGSPYTVQINPFTSSLQDSTTDGDCSCHVTSFNTSPYLSISKGKCNVDGESVIVFK